jgi:hypothetical protein
VRYDFAIAGQLLAAFLICLVGCGNSSGTSDAGVADAGMMPLPDGGCLHATDCASGTHCSCGFLNVNFASRGCDAPGTCIAALPVCNPSQPDNILCDVDGGCPLSGACEALGYCSTPWCSRPDASSDAPSDASPDAIVPAEAATDSGSIDAEAGETDAIGSD